MNFQPFKNHFQCATGHLTFDYTILYANNHFIISIPSMEMSRCKVCKIHQDYYPVEKTNLWHAYYIKFKNALQNTNFLSY